MHSETEVGTAQKINKPIKERLQRPGGLTGAGGKFDSCSFLMIATDFRSEDSPGFPHSVREYPRLLSCLISHTASQVVFQACGVDVMFSQLGRKENKNYFSPLWSKTKAKQSSTPV